MPESRQEAIERLLREGLDHYGMGQVQRAIACWQRVLSLEPGHPQAREYLETAVEDPAGAAPSAAPPADPNSELLEEGLRRLHGDDPETALELFEAVAERDPDRLEVHGYVEMVRSRLLKCYRERMGSGTAVPRMRLSPDQIMRYNLPPDAGFLLSFVDGGTSVDDLISVCAMDEFRTLRLLAQMMDAGILELSP